jgi:ATP-dependent Clp protease ATP-binding subunit ClpC
MYERFTDPARAVMQAAAQEAENAKSGYLGSEHILLGLIAKEHGLAAMVLKSLGVDADALRSDLEKLAESRPPILRPGVRRMTEPPRALTSDSRTGTF